MKSSHGINPIINVCWLRYLFLGAFFFRAFSHGIRIVGDEMHSLRVYPPYYTLREELFPTQWQTNDVCQRAFYNNMSDKNKRRQNCPIVEIPL